MGTDGSLRAAKRSAFQGVVAQLGGGLLDVQGLPLLVRRGQDDLRLERTLPDGTEVLVHIATVKDGMPAGHFALWPSLLLSRGPLRQMLDEVPLPVRHLDAIGALLFASGAVGPDERLSYPIRRSAGDSMSIRRVSVLVGETFMPVIRGSIPLTLG